MLLLVGQDMGTGRTFKIFLEKRRWSPSEERALGLNRDSLGTALAAPLTSPLCAPVSGTLKLPPIVALRLNQGQRGHFAENPDDVTLPSTILGPWGQGGQEADVYLACWDLPEDRPASHPWSQQPALPSEPTQAWSRGVLCLLRDPPEAGRRPPPLPTACPILPLSLATLWERDLIVLSRDQSSRLQRPAPPMPCRALGRAQPAFT